MSEDGILILVAIGGIALLTVLVQLMGMKLEDSQDNLRKVLHFLVILICAYVIGTISDPGPLRWLFFVFTGVLLLVVKLKLLNISQGKSFGIALFPLAFAILLMIDGLPRSYIVLSAIILAIADPLAGLIGSNYAKGYWKPLDEEKSWLGSIVFFGSCGIILSLGQNSDWIDTELSLSVVAILLITLLTTFSEMFSWRGSDNLFIPLVTALSMQAVMIHGETEGAIVAIVVLIAGFGLVNLKWLNVGGMLAVVMMATWIALMIDPAALGLPVLFLIVGSLLSKLNRGDKSLAKDDSGGRNANQVFANGGMGMMMAVPYLLTHYDHFLFLFALVFAAAMSDTASSEVGRRMKGKTWSLATMKKVVPGGSGGVSIVGTLAGFVGALLIGGTAYFVLEISITDVVLLTILGFIGMLIDSVLGAFIQGKYRVHGILQEEGRQDQLISGIHWIDNSMVNFLSVTLIVLIAYCCL